jgi:hypothetical protein
MTTQHSVVTAVGDVVEQGANSAETIHRAVAGLPFDIIEGLQSIDAPLKEARKLQNKAIDAVYNLVRSVNRDVQQIANELIDTGEKSVRVIDPKAAGGDKPRRAAAKA